MSGDRVCVTNDVASLRSCTNEDGTPRRAVAGYLCAMHLTKLDAALTDADPLVRHMLEDGGNGIRDTNVGGGTRSHESSIPIPESRLLSSWIVAAMSNAIAVLAGNTTVDLTYLDHRGSLPAGAETISLASEVAHLQTCRDELIGTPLGAEAAVRLTRVVQSAYIRFPLVETRRRIVGVRCRQCGLDTLDWRPPLMYRGDVVIRCENCGNEEPQSWLEQYAAIVEFR